MTIDTSSYSNALTQPMKPLEMLGQYQGIQNAMVQNQLMQSEIPIRQAQAQQEQNQTAYSNAKIKALQMLSNTKYHTASGTDTNAWLSDMAQDPTTAPYVPEASQTAISLNRPTDTGAVNASGNPVFSAAQTVSAKYSPSGGPASISQENPANLPSGASSQAIGIPPDPLKQLDYYQAKQAAGDVSQKDLAPLENVYNTIKKNPTDQGTILGTLNTYLAQHNIDISGSKDAASALQIIKDHASQLNIPLSSDSDKDAFAREAANLNPKDLGGSLLKMIPYLAGVRNMNYDQAQILKKADPNGTNPPAIGDVRSSLQGVSDPRLYELQWLSQHDQDAYQKRIQALSQPEKDYLSAMGAQLKKIKNPVQQLPQ